MKMQHLTILLWVIIGEVGCIGFVYNGNMISLTLALCAPWAVAKLIRPNSFGGERPA